MIATRTIGSSGIEVTELSFGGAPLGAVGDRISAETAAAIVHRAHRGGIRYFDTAPLYGHGLSEKRLGETLRTLPRDDLCSDQGRPAAGAGSRGRTLRGMRDTEPVAIRYDYSYDAVRRSLEASLERLASTASTSCSATTSMCGLTAMPSRGIFDTARKRRAALPCAPCAEERRVVRIGLSRSTSGRSAVADGRDGRSTVPASPAVHAGCEQEPAAGSARACPRMKEPRRGARGAPSHTHLPATRYVPAQVRRAQRLDHHRWTVQLRHPRHRRPAPGHVRLQTRTRTPVAEGPGDPADVRIPRRGSPCGGIAVSAATPRGGGGHPWRLGRRGGRNQPWTDRDEDSGRALARSRGGGSRPCGRVRRCARRSCY